MDNKIAQIKKNTTNIFLNKYFNLILSFFVLALLVAAYFLFIGPKFQSTRSVIQDNIANQKALYAQQKKKSNSLKEIAKTYSEISTADLEKFNTVLPLVYQQERLFGEFEEIIAKGGWILNAVEILDSENDSPSLQEASSMTGSANDKVQELRISLTVQAIDYAGLKTLLKMLENNLRLFDVVDVNFSGESVGIILNTYYYGDAPQITKEPLQ